jgi:hypothetical protein
MWEESMEVKIGDDEGIEIKFAGGVLEVSIFGERGLITISEARMAADVLRLMAEHLERSLHDGD